MGLRTKLKSYLNRLRESNDSGQVPTIRDLAKAIEMQETTVFNISNNNIKQLSFKTGSKIIAEMRRRGYDMQVEDLIEYVEDDD